MSVHTDEELSALVWAGDYRAVQIARDIFEQKPLGSLPILASTLYSFRDRCECRYQLAELFPRLVMGAKALTDSIEREPTPQKADQADVLSTIILYTLTLGELFARYEIEACRSCLTVKDPYQTALDRIIDVYAVTHDLVRQLVTVALANPDCLKPHTAALLSTTAFSLAETRKERQQHLRQAKAVLPSITDKKQRVRVLKRVGWAQLSQANLKGGYYIFRALTLGGVPKAVKKKIFLR